MDNGRNKNGQFASGNAGGPGRPRRMVEHDYLAALGDVVSLVNWREIVERAVADAKAGDARARDWITKYLIGNEPPKLVDLAAREQRGATVDEIVEEAANKQANDEQWATVTNQLLGDLAKR